MGEMGEMGEMIVRMASSGRKDIVEAFLETEMDGIGKVRGFIDETKAMTYANHANTVFEGQQRQRTDEILPSTGDAVGLVERVCRGKIMPMTKQSDDAAPRRQIDKDGSFFVEVEKSSFDGYKPLQGIRGIEGTALEVIAAHVKAQDNAMSGVKEFLDAQEENKATIEKYRKMFAGAPKVRDEVAVLAARAAASTGIQPRNRAAAIGLSHTVEVQGGSSLTEIPIGFTPEPAAEVPPPPTIYSTAELFMRLIEAPLYDEIQLHGKPASTQIIELRKADYRFDYYCPGCKKPDTPWRMLPHASTSTLVAHSTGLGIFTLTAQCQRVPAQHLMYVNIYAEAIPNPDEQSGTITTLRKYGQFPALAEFHTDDLAKYDKVTSRSQRSDFVRAVAAASHGFAAGACTYLRRILESFKDEALVVHRESDGADDANWEEKYSRATFTTQVEMLSEFLPQFFVENKRIYNVLSEGLHNLTDAQCTELFPQLREAVELIFEDKLAVAQGKRRQARSRKFIAQNDPGRKA